MSQNLKDFAKEQDYRRQFSHLNETISQDNKIRGSTPFNKDVDSGRHGAVGGRYKSWIPLKLYYSCPQFFSWISSLSSTWTNKKSALEEITMWLEYINC